MDLAVRYYNAVLTVDGPHVPNGEVDMPYCGRSTARPCLLHPLGHHNDVIAAEPALTLMKRGFAWAAAGKEIARKEAAAR